MSKKIISFISLICLVLIALPLFSAKVQAQNIGSLKNVVTPGFSFTMDLAPGYTDQDVKELQKVLNADPDTVVSLEDENSKGKETKYFNDKTKAAVIKFQEKYKDVILTPSGLTKGTGFVGKATRTKLNLLIGVFNTYPSTGVPESTGVSTVVANPAPAVVTPPVATGVSMTMCQFINILKNVGIITEARAVQAGTNYNCPALNSTIVSPTVVLRVNGERGTVKVPVNTTVTASWTSKNVTACSSNGVSKPFSGSKSILIDTSGTITIACTGPGGSVSDTVTVMAISTSPSTPTNTGNYDYLLPNFNGNGLVVQKVLTSTGYSEDIVVVPESSSLKTDSKVTLEAWVKPTSWRSEDGMDNTKDEIIISKGNLGGNIDYALSLNNGKLVYGNNDSSLWTCNALVPLNVWTHVAATVDESARNISLYVNGVKASNICEGARGTDTQTSINKQYAISNSTGVNSNVYIGNYSAKYCDAQLRTNGFIGSLDDIRIWNLVRTESEIKNSMATSVKNIPGLVADWTFDNGTVSDITTNSNNGLIKGGMQIVADNTSSSTIVSATNAYSFNYNSSIYTPCEQNVSGNDEATTTEEDEPFELNFAGTVEFVSSCGSENNPNKYSSVVIKSVDGTRPVVGVINGSPTAWQRNFGGDFGMSNPNTRLVLRHSPNTGAPLPKVGDCVLGSSTGEPDVCSTTTEKVNIKGLPPGTTLEQACKGTGGAFEAGGIIKKLGTDSSGSCKNFEGNLDEGSGGSDGSIWPGGFGLQTGGTISGAYAGGVVGCAVAGPIGCAAGAVIGGVIGGAVGNVGGKVLKSFGL